MTPAKGCSNKVIILKVATIAVAALYTEVNPQCKVAADTGANAQQLIFLLSFTCGRLKPKWVCLTAGAIQQAYFYHPKVGCQWGADADECTKGLLGSTQKLAVHIVAKPQHSAMHQQFSDLQVLLQAAGMNTAIPALLLQLLPKEYILLQTVIHNPGLLSDVGQAATHPHIS